MDENSHEPKRINIICIKAIEDIQKRAQLELNKAGFPVKEIPFVEASKVLGLKYFRKNYGKIPTKELIKMWKGKLI